MAKGRDNTRPFSFSTGPGHPRYWLTALRQRSKSSSNDSAYSSAVFPALPPKPAPEAPFPYPVVTAMNFINSSATSSFEFFVSGSFLLSSAIDIGKGFPSFRVLLTRLSRSSSACPFAPRDT